MENRYIENQKRLLQKYHSTSRPTVGAGFSWRVRALADHSVDLRFPVPLVPQQTGMSCWAAGAAMVVAWREHYSADPAQIVQAAGAWAAYSAGLHPESTAIFPIWGLTPEPQQAYSVDGFRQLLDTYGPLWVAGAVPGPHIRVVTGIYGDGSSEGTKVLINDPWQQGMTTFALPNTGAQYEETYSQFVAATERLARQEAKGFPKAIYVARSTRPRTAGAQAHSLNGFARANGTRQSYRFVPNVRARALSIPVDFDVPRPVPGLKKPSPMTCWAAATAMLVSYKEGKPVSVEEAVRRAGGRYEQLLQSDAALAKADMADYLSTLGLVSQPAADLSVEQVDQMLRRFGAVWLTPDEDATFSWDARIVTGIHGDGTPRGTNVVLFDPGNGTEALIAFNRLNNVFVRQSLSNLTGQLMAIHWPPDTLGAAIPHETKAVALTAVDPFAEQAIGPQMVRDANRTRDLTDAIAMVKGTLNPANQRRLDQVAFAIAKLGTGNNPVEYAGLHDEDMFFSGSLLKLAVLYASFELRSRVNKLAPSIPAGSPNDFFKQVEGAFGATIAAAVPSLPAGQWRSVKFDRVLTAWTADASGHFYVDLSVDHRADLAAMIADQNQNETPSRCIQRLGYSYINGALAAAGLFDPNTKKGIWYANDIGGGWPQFSVPVATNGKSSEAMTAVALANLLTAMHRGTLIDQASSQEMMGIIANGGSWISQATNAGALSFTSTGAKVGHSPSNDAKVSTVKSEGLFLDHSGTPFVAVWQNYPDAVPGVPGDVSNVYRVIDEVVKNWP